MNHLAQKTLLVDRLARLAGVLIGLLESSLLGLGHKEADCTIQTFVNANTTMSQGLETSFVLEHPELEF